MQNYIHSYLKELKLQGSYSLLQVCLWGGDFSLVVAFAVVFLTCKLC